jgi:twitching motility protein PilT
VRLGLATSLRGIVCQRLVPRADGDGRTVAMEIAVNNPRLAEAVADPDKTDAIEDIIAMGSYDGTQTFDQHLVRMVLDGTVSVRDAKMFSSNPHDMSVMLKRAGIDPALVDEIG